MNKSGFYAVIIFLVFVILILCVLLFQNEQTIKHQTLIISQQEQTIKAQNAQIQKLSEVTPENILRMTGSFAKDKGMDILKQILSPK